MKQLLFFSFTVLTVLFFSCEKKENDIKYDSVTIANSDTLVYSLGSFGDEEGAIIIIDPIHYELSKIQRDSDYSELFYVYKADSNYVGSDYVEIRSEWGSFGSGANTEFLVTKLSINVIE